MTKKDLKSGMIVELRAGARWLVLTDCETRSYGKQDFCLVRDGGLALGSNFNGDLTDVDGALEYDIVKVYGRFVGSNTFKMTSDDIIWERPPQKETITIGSVKYDKAEFEEAVKNLKVVN